MLPRAKNGGIDFRNKQKGNTFISWWFEVNLNKEMVVVFLFVNNWLRRSFHRPFWKDKLAFVSKLNSKKSAAQISEQISRFEKKKREKSNIRHQKVSPLNITSLNFYWSCGWEPRLFPYFFMEKVDFKTGWRQIWTGRIVSFALQQIHESLL